MRIQSYLRFRFDKNSKRIKGMLEFNESDFVERHHCIGDEVSLAFLLT